MRAKLTPFGVAYYRSFRRNADPAFVLPKGNIIKIPLWEFAQVFGPVIWMGMRDVPTVGNEIEILTP